MTSTGTSHDRTLQPTQAARRAYAVNAGIAWLGVVLTVVLSAPG